jgi:hypothetical protein
MFVLELCDCQSEDLFGRELIVPYFLEESCFFSNHILVRAAMRGVKTADINPAISSKTTRTTENEASRPDWVIRRIRIEVVSLIHISKSFSGMVDFLRSLRFFAAKLCDQIEPVGVGFGVLGDFFEDGIN